MKPIRKAVVTAAAPNQHHLPLQQLVDRDGREKTALAMFLEQSAQAGIEEICVVIRPGDEDAYRGAAAAAGDSAAIDFVVQPSADGYADAILRAKDFVGDDPFLHSVGDHVYLSTSEKSCVAQLIDIATARRGSVSAVQPTRENNLPYFGVVSGPHVGREDHLYEVQKVVEKPTPTRAEQELVTPGLRSGYYLGFFGIHVLAPEVMPLLEQVASRPQTNGHGRPTLSDALAMLPSRGTYLAAALDGTRYNLGAKYGLLRAQLAISLAGQDRDQILSELVDLMATRTLGASS